MGKYNPHEVMPVTMPELAHVVFDPWNDSPCNGHLRCSTIKCGDVMEVDASRSVEAKIKTNSPFGRLSLGSTVLAWRLCVEGHVTAKQAAGNSRATRFEVELRFMLECSFSQIGDATFAAAHVPPIAWTSQQVPVGKGPDLGAPRSQNAPHDLKWNPSAGVSLQNNLEACIDVMPSIQPSFERGPNGTFVMEIPNICLKFATTCTPPPPLIAGAPAFKPSEDVPISMPEISHLVFDPQANLPRDGRLRCTARMNGNIMLFRPTDSVDAKLKTNSPHGSLALKDVKTGSEAILNWKLQVEGTLSVLRNAGVAGSQRRDGELYLTFECHLCL